MLETQSLFSGLDRNAAMLPRAVAARNTRRTRMDDAQA
jgi:hypothetical protein